MVSGVEENFPASYENHNYDLWPKYRVFYIIVGNIRNDQQDATL